MRLFYRIGKDFGRAAQGEDPAGRQTAADIAMRFGRGKLAPVPSYFTDMITRKTFIGEDFKPGKGIMERAIPLMWKDTVEAYRKEGISGAAKMSPGFFGVGVQDYALADKPKPATSRRPVRPSRPSRPSARP